MLLNKKGIDKLQELLTRFWNWLASPFTPKPVAVNCKDESSGKLYETSGNVMVEVCLKDGGIKKMKLADSIVYIDANPDKVGLRKTKARRPMIEDGISSN